MTVESLKEAGDERGRKENGEAAYSAPDGSLRHTLILRYSQTGFAGESSHIWMLETDGAWRRQPFLNKNVRNAEQEGKLRKKQLQILGRELANYDLLALPERMGKDPGVNPHIISISFGKKRCAMILRGGALLPKRNPENMDTPKQRLASLVRVLRRQMKAEKPK